MASGKYFKGVKALDSPHIGHVVCETEEAIVVFGGVDDGYDIPKSAIKFVSGNVIVGMDHKCAFRCKVDRDAPLSD